MRFEVLGSLRVVARVAHGGSNAPIAQPSIGGPKQRFVLARLLAEPNRVVSLDRLIDGLWGDDPPETARHTIQGYVSELRKTVGPWIERDGVGYRVTVDRDTFDALEFEARLGEARAQRPLEPELAATELELAIGLWRGAAYADFHEAALQAEATRLEELRIAAFEELMQIRLAAGSHAEVIGQLERSTREHPYREELRALHMVALYRAGRQADALRAYQVTRDVLAEDLGIVPSPRLRRLEEQILLQDPDLDPAPARAQSAPTESRWLENPFLGLRAFREADHARFFGQDQLVDRLVGRVMGSSRFTALVGPSGSGKSSVVQAGLVPRLRLDYPGIVIASMQPGAQPYAVLEAALAQLPGVDSRAVGRQLSKISGGLLDAVQPILHGNSQRFLLVVDQFEELFTMVDQAETTRFLALLAETAGAAESNVHVLVTLRADFYDRPLADPRIGQLFADNVVSVVALGPDQLEAAATLPARQLDITVEPRLVGRLIADVAGQPNALPLFQYALTELFDAREGHVLDLATYERIGGVRKAVARRAESLYGQLQPAEQETARQLFLRIATVSGDIVGRRRVPASELVSLDVDVIALKTAIDAFARYRLLALDRDPATGSPTVEVAHEALLVEWHRLRDWIDQYRDDLAKQSSFLVAVNEWEQSGRDAGYLLTGTRLADYERWTQSTHLRLTATEHDFITAAVAARELETAAHVEREHVQLKLRRRSRRQLLLLFGVVAVFGGVIAYPIVNGDSGPSASIAAVLASRRADSALDELVGRGIESSAKQFNLDSTVLEPPYTDIEAQIRALADTGPSLMFASLQTQGELAAIAPDYPHTDFVMIDDTRQPKADNVVSLAFAHEQGSFLVGAAAALESVTKKVGYIGANSLPFIESFRAGFEQGAAAADPGVQVVSDLIFPRRSAGDDGSGYQDPEIAKDIATKMYNDGVDVIFVAAGQSGTGVIEASTELSTPSRKLWAIGVDTDQFFDVNDDQRAHLLTSMYKRTDLATAAVVAAKLHGKLHAPSIFTATLADGAVGYTNTGGHLRPSTIEALESLKAQIVDRTIVVNAVPATEPPTDVNDTFTFDLRTGARAPLPSAIAGASHYAVSPDGSKLARLPCCHADTMTISDIDGTNAITTSAPDGTHFWWPEWSPDGTKLVFQQRDAVYATDLGVLVVDDLVTGQRTQVTDFPSTLFWWWWMPPQFSPDGRSVIFHKPRGAAAENKWDVWSVPITGGEPHVLLEDAALPAYLPNGEIAYVLSSNGDVPDSLWIGNPGTGERRKLVSQARDGIFMPSVSPDGTRIAYPDGESIFVVDVATGVTSEVVGGIAVDWLDDDTLIVIGA